MALEQAFLDMMHDTVLHKIHSGRDEYGKPSYIDGEVYPAYWQHRQQLVRLKDGSEKVSRGTVYTTIETMSLNERDDRIVLPDGTMPEVFLVDHYTDEFGEYHHTRIVHG